MGRNAPAHYSRRGVVRGDPNGITTVMIYVFAHVSSYFHFHRLGSRRNLCARYCASQPFVLPEPIA